MCVNCRCDLIRNLIRKCIGQKKTKSKSILFLPSFSIVDLMGVDVLTGTKSSLDVDRDSSNKSSIL